MNDTQSSSVIGSSVTKTDALSLACGACRFTADADLRNPLFVAFAYSPYPFADILSIDSGEARDVPGVVDDVRALHALRHRRRDDEQGETTVALWITLSTRRTELP